MDDHADTPSPLAAEARPGLPVSINQTRLNRRKAWHKRKPTVTEMREAIERCNGTLTSLARQLNCPDNAAHFYLRRWLYEQPENDALFQQKQQELTDRAEDILMENLCTPGPKQLKTAMFILERVPNIRFNPACTKEGEASLLQTVNALIKHALTPDPAVTSSDVDNEEDDEAADA